MKSLCLCSSIPLILPLSATALDLNGRNFTNFTIRSPRRRFSPRLTVNCRSRAGEDPSPVLSSSTAFAVLGIHPNCSTAELKAAFRAKVKEYHPDVNRGGGDSDTMIRRVIQAYEILSNYSRSEIIESLFLPFHFSVVILWNIFGGSMFTVGCALCRECLDPFDSPECEAFDVFVNEVLCVGKGCPYSCVKRAPRAFTYDPSTGTARATSQGHAEDYQVQLAVGQCPRSCIHFVTPSQRIILEELLDSILDKPFDTSAEADLLYSLIVKAKFENNRYQKPKKQPKTSTKNVDWF
ncbi:Chaperone DnaJ-domain superfamily protein [Theobroma cacao]|uniref:Chaperone DnaJ-domain superfamily protein n=1 Tax=Theobroma cacao TaxID=3641 RepID=A0A061FA07_THECC|nr:Chaperone DnaJ-domain superfamily protein [Theobroma cacao]